MISADHARDLAGSGLPWPDLAPAPAPAGAPERDVAAALARHFADAEDLVLPDGSRVRMGDLWSRSPYLRHASASAVRGLLRARSEAGL
jgi:hypothetical protein